LVLKYSRAVHGKVIALQKLRLQAPANDLLVVVTDQPQCFTLSWNSEKSQLQTEQSRFEIGMSGRKDSMNTSTCMIDGEQTFMGLGIFDGVVTLVPLTTVKRKKKSSPVLGVPILSGVRELLIRSSAFLYGLKKPTLALLWEDAHGGVFVNTKEIDYLVGDEGNAELKDGRTVKKHVERAARFLIPVPESQGKHLGSLGEAF
jgi:hypothetical protein